MKGYQTFILFHLSTSSATWGHGQYRDIHLAWHNSMWEMWHFWHLLNWLWKKETKRNLPKKRDPNVAAAFFIRSDSLWVFFRCGRSLELPLQRISLFHQAKSPTTSGCWLATNINKPNRKSRWAADFSKSRSSTSCQLRLVQSTCRTSAKGCRAERKPFFIIQREAIFLFDPTL